MRLIDDLVRSLPLDPRAARIVDETLRDWRHEAEGQSGLRRVGIDVRGAASVGWVLLRTGGGLITSRDLSWMATRLGLPVAAIVLLICLNTQQLRGDLLRLPISWWPLRTLAELAQALGAIPVFLPPVLFIAVLLPGARSRVPWVRAALVMAAISLTASLTVQPWGRRVGVGLHYLTFAIQRGMPTSPSSMPEAWPTDAAPIAAHVAAAALASLAMAACAAGLRSRTVVLSRVTSMAAAPIAFIGYFVVLAVPSIVQILWPPWLIRSSLWHTWSFALAPLFVALVAAGAAMLFRGAESSRAEARR